MNFTMPEWLIIVALGTITTIVGWGFRRMVAAQDHMSDKMGGLALEVTRLCGKIELSAVLASQFKSICDGRHEENTDRLNQLHDDIARLKPGRA